MFYGNALELLDKEMQALERRRLVVMTKIEFLGELEDGTPSSAENLLKSPSVNISKALREGMLALGQFTKNDVLKWVRSNYPFLDFSPKSLGRPLGKMIERGEVVILKQNIGNKTQAVYGLVSSKAV